MSGEVYGDVWGWFKSEGQWKKSNKGFSLSWVRKTIEEYLDCVSSIEDENNAIVFYYYGSALLKFIPNIPIGINENNSVNENKTIKKRAGRPSKVKSTLKMIETHYPEMMETIRDGRVGGSEVAKRFEVSLPTAQVVVKTIRGGVE